MMQILVQQHTRSSKGGFIALSLVTLFTLIATFFIISSAERTWMISRNVLDRNKITQARFNAFSCIGIARLNLFLGENVIDSTYKLENGTCEIGSVRQIQDSVNFKAIGRLGGAENFLGSEVRTDSFEIGSISETDPD